MKRSFGQVSSDSPVIENDVSEVPDYILCDSPSPKDNIDVTARPIIGNSAYDLSGIDQRLLNAAQELNIINIRPPLMRPFMPANNAERPIMSTRMGPPYLNGMGIPMLQGLSPAVRPMAPFPGVVTYRHRLFGPGPFVRAPQRFVAGVISIDDESSSSSGDEESSNHSSEDDETDNSSNNQSEKENENTKAVEKENEKENEKEKEKEVRSEVRATMKAGPSRVEPIVITISDDESDGENPTITSSRVQKIRKAKLSADGKSTKSTGKTKDDASLALQNLFGKGDEDENMKDLIQGGIDLINQEELGKAFEEAKKENFKPKKINTKALYSNVKHGNTAKVIAFLNAGANPVANVRGEEGRTCLHIAAAKGHLEILMILIYKAGAGKIDCLDSRSRSPLFAAIEKKQLNVAQFLMKAGANIHIKNHEGITLLHVAARRGYEAIVKWLIRAGISINEQDIFGYSALMWAVEHDSNKDITTILIRNGANANLLDNEKNICLHWAAIAGSFECTRVLVTSSSDAQVNARNKFGETPLHVAAKGDHYHVTQYLLLHGADYRIKNEMSLTPLDVCPAGSKTFHCIRIRKEVGQSKKTHYMYISDVSRGKEKIPVSCLNEVDSDPFPNDFVYVVRPEASAHVTVSLGLSTVKPCKCETVCGVECNCVKLSEKQKLWYTDDGKVDVSLFEEDSPVLFECTPLCSCWSYCPNRVVQKGIQHPLQVFKTKTKGWGLRTLTEIRKGAFILSYVGELITDDEAERRNADTYLFNLDLKTTGDEPNCMDALRYGNCGRFINHSCNANMKAVKLFSSHRDISFPEVAFFAFRDIEPKEELCFDYGDSFWDVKNESGIYCKCEWVDCSYGKPKKNVKNADDI